MKTTMIIIASTIFLYSCSKKGFNQRDYLDKNKNIFVLKEGLENEPETIWLEDKFGVMSRQTKKQFKKRYKRWKSWR